MPTTPDETLAAVELASQAIELLKRCYHALNAVPNQEFCDQGGEEAETYDLAHEIGRFLGKEKRTDPYTCEKCKQDVRDCTCDTDYYEDEDR